MSSKSIPSSQYTISWVERSLRLKGIEPERIYKAAEFKKRKESCEKADDSRCLEESVICILDLFGGSHHYE